MPRAYQIEGEEICCWFAPTDSIIPLHESFWALRPQDVHSITVGMYRKEVKPSLHKLVGSNIKVSQRLLWLATNTWPLFEDRRKFSQMADPMLQGHYPLRDLYQALAVAAMCVYLEPNMRPLIADVATALSSLASQMYDPKTQLPVQSSPTSSSTLRTRREQ